MNLVGRYLEEGWEVAADPLEAREWYRQSAEAGDFRGQASHAQVLLGQGRIDEAIDWFKRAIASGSPSFLSHVGTDLARSSHASIRAIAEAARHQLVQVKSGATSAANV